MSQHRWDESRTPRLRAITDADGLSQKGLIGVDGSAEESSRLRWAAVEWARTCDLGIPDRRQRTDPVFNPERQLLMLLAMICELPSGRIEDYSYEDWGLVLGLSEMDVLEAADILSALDLSFRTGELTRPGTSAVLCLPIEALQAQVELSFQCSRVSSPDPSLLDAPDPPF